MPEDKTELKNGTTTKIDENLQILYLRIVFTDKNINEPTVYSGVLHNIQRKEHQEWIKKFENVMNLLEYGDDKILVACQRADISPRFSPDTFLGNSLVFPN